MKSHAFIYIKEMGTDKLIKSIKVNLPISENKLDKMETGISHQMNLDKYYIDDNEIIEIVRGRK